MSNPFLEAKRQVPKRKHPALRGTKYPELWKMEVSELRELYANTDDNHKRGAITRAINEKLGIKVIRTTPKQIRARVTNYIRFVSTGYQTQITQAAKELSDLAKEAGNLTEALRLRLLVQRLFEIDTAIERAKQEIEDHFSPSTEPRKRTRDPNTWRNK